MLRKLVPAVRHALLDALDDFAPRARAQMARTPAPQCIVEQMLGDPLVRHKLLLDEALRC